MKIDDIINKVHCCDCLEFIKSMPDKCVDSVLTDPPYGIGMSFRNWQGYKDPDEFQKRIKNKQKVRGQGVALPIQYKSSDWDKSIPSKEYFDEILRVSKNQIIFGGNYMTNFLPPSSCWIVWDKDNEGSNFADCELAWTSFNKAIRKYLWRWHGMLQQNMKDKDTRVHPSQKPEGLLKYILQDWSKETDLIFDPFLGSGTTAIAYIELKRNFIGCEISPEYCKIAEERIEKAKSQLQLF